MEGTVLSVTVIEAKGLKAKDDNGLSDPLCEVIYGNNFHGYDDRILSREERTDPTNAVLKIIPHLKTEPINGLMSKPSSGVESDLLVKMENAFNDCVVMIFDAQNSSNNSEDYGEGDGTCWPDRPKEYVFDDEGGDGEVI